MVKEQVITTTCDPATEVSLGYWVFFFWELPRYHLCLPRKKRQFKV